MKGEEGVVPTYSPPNVVTRAMLGSTGKGRPISLGPCWPSQAGEPISLGPCWKAGQGANFGGACWPTQPRGPTTREIGYGLVGNSFRLAGKTSPPPQLGRVGATPLQRVPSQTVWKRTPGKKFGATGGRKVGQPSSWWNSPGGGGARLQA